jgi:hypothetical protein
MGVNFRWEEIKPNPIKAIVPGTGEVAMPTLRIPMPNTIVLFSTGGFTTPTLKILLLNNQGCCFQHRGVTTPTLKSPMPNNHGGCFQHRGGYYPGTENFYA